MEKDWTMCNGALVDFGYHLDLEEGEVQRWDGLVDNSTGLSLSMYV